MTIKFRNIFFLLIIVYSITLLGLEWAFSQNFVRHFTADIEKGHMPFYGINTSLTVFFLWATALIFTICLTCVESLAQRQEKHFFLSQIVFFVYLGIDDRFMVHETLSHWFRESYVLFGLGIIEVYCLITLGQLSQRPRRALIYLGIGTGSMFVMLLADKVIPEYLLWRLSVEDLSKLWGAGCLFLFAWEILLDKIQQLKTINQN